MSTRNDGSSFEASSGRQDVGHAAPGEIKRVILECTDRISTLGSQRRALEEVRRQVLDEELHLERRLAGIEEEHLQLTQRLESMRAQVHRDEEALRRCLGEVSSLQGRCMEAEGRAEELSQEVVLAEQELAALQTVLEGSRLMLDRAQSSIVRILQRLEHREDRA